MAELRILIADDHALIRRGVRDLLSTRAQWRIVAEASDGAEAVRKVIQLKPHVAILDFTMPEMSGPQAAAAIARSAPDTAVIVLTMHNCDHVAQQVRRSGARGLVLKSDADRTLLGAVEEVAGRRYGFSEQNPKFTTEGYVTDTNKPRTAGKDFEPRLTKREGEIIRLLAEGMTSKQVAMQLRISIRTVESHRNNMSRKLGFSSIADMIRYAIRSGIVAAA